MFVKGTMKDGEVVSYEHISKNLLRIVRHRVRTPRVRHARHCQVLEFARPDYRPGNGVVPARPYHPKKFRPME